MRLKLGKKTLIMGVLNVTPDSFHDGDRYFDKSKAIERAYQIEREGADIIDIGGESSRPGSDPIPINAEIDRVCPIIEEISKSLKIPISIDTYKSKVAEEAIEAGASIINDISSLLFDEKMIEVAMRYDTYLILMHMKGKPKTMQDNPQYENLLDEIGTFLRDSADRAIRGGVKKDKIIVDPGIGFGKTLIQNYEIINNIDYFKRIGFPVLIGLSMKSLIGKLYDEKCDRLPATIALNAISIIKGADIIRVHNVEEHRLALAAIEKLKEAVV
jgi:dihydropteroate synthase